MKNVARDMGFLYRRRRLADSSSKAEPHSRRQIPKVVTNQDRWGSRSVIRFFFFCELFPMKLYVGNLPFNATEDAVRTHFSAHGTVDKVTLVNDRETGRPRGFGFVEMPNADATRAMQALDGKDFGGRPLKVNEAQERDRGAPRGNFGGGGGGGRRF
jgi:RNA recognition motif-containing protein